MFKVTSRWPHQDSIKVEWNLGKRCNYDCSYCPASIHDNSSEHTDIEILKDAVDCLIKLGKPIRLSFTGGEPTVHPKFEELINYCKHVGISWISVTTNGTRKPEWYARQRVDQYVFSIHFEYDFQRALHTATSLKSTDKALVVQLMAHHDHMSIVKDAADYLGINIKNNKSTHSFELFEVCWVGKNDSRVILPKQVQIDLNNGKILSNTVRFLED